MGYKIEVFRKAKGMTQEELSAASGVSRAIIASLESGARTNTTTKTLVSLAKALDTTVDNIFFDDSV